MYLTAPCPKDLAAFRQLPIRSDEWLPIATQPVSATQPAWHATVFLHAVMLATGQPTSGELWLYGLRFAGVDPLQRLWWTPGDVSPGI